MFIRFYGHVHRNEMKWNPFSTFNWWNCMALDSYTSYWIVYQSEFSMHFQWILYWTFCFLFHILPKDDRKLNEFHHKIVLFVKFITRFFQLNIFYWKICQKIKIHCLIWFDCNRESITFYLFSVKLMSNTFHRVLIYQNDQTNLSQLIETEERKK